MRRSPAFGLLVAWLLSLGAAGCAVGANPSPFVGRVLATHQEADALLARGDLDAARANLVALVSAEPPAGMAPADVRVIRQDALYRLVEVELSADRAPSAMAFADQGLALGGGDDLFVANLYVGRGQALERLGRDAEAAQAYHRALAINERLLDEALGGEGGEAK